MTDLEKIKNLLDGMRIVYKECNEIEPILDDYCNILAITPIIRLNILSHLEDKRGAGLDIIFSKDGAFNKFDTFGCYM